MNNDRNNHQNYNNNDDDGINDVKVIRDSTE